MANDAIDLPYVSFIYREMNRDSRQGHTSYIQKEYSGYVLRRNRNGSFLLVDKPTKIKETRDNLGELVAVDFVIGNIEGLFEPLGVVRYFHTPVEDRP